MIISQIIVGGTVKRGERARSFYRFIHYVRSACSTALQLRQRLWITSYRTDETQNLNIKLAGLSQEEKLKSAIEKYAEMEQWYGDFLNSEDGQNCVTEFERFLPDYKWISNIKKVDALLWSAR